MSRLFISHSSADNVRALAFRNWLLKNDWSEEHIFIDIHDIGAGHRWRDTLRKASYICEAVLFLASSDALNSTECQEEVNLAKALGKEVIVALLRDVEIGDQRLARFKDEQIVNLSSFPQDQIEALIWEGREHRIQFNVDALQKIKSRLKELGIAPETFAWPPKGVTDPEPYPGLAAFTEEDAGIFFGRDVDIVNALNDIRLVRERKTKRLIVIDASSGAGKSSFLRAGLWPRLRRDNDLATLGVLRPAQGILSGPDGVGRKLSLWMEALGKPKSSGAIYAPLLAEDEEVAIRAFRSLFTDAVHLITSARRATNPDAPVPSPVIAIDQGEELFAPENDVESRRFLRLLANLLNDPPETVDPYVIVTIRADSKEALLGRIAELSMDLPDPNYLPPLSTAAYREVILRPAEVYSARERRVTIDPALVNALVQDATGGDALPLMAFTLSRMFADFKSEGTLTLAQYQETGGIAGSIGRALKQAQVRAGAGGSDAHLRRLLLPGLATWDPDANGGVGAAKRLVAPLSEIVGGTRSDLGPIADALVEARLLTRGRDTLEVAHEALLRIPPLEDWLLADRDFLAWRDRLGKARAAYEANIRELLVGRELEIARTQLDQRAESDDIAEMDKQFILKSIEEQDKRRTIEEERERKQQEAELAAAKAREEAAEAARFASEAKAAAEQEKAAAAAAELAAAKAREEAAEANAAAEQEKAAAAAASAALQVLSARRFARRIATTSAVAFLTLLAVGLGLYLVRQQQQGQLAASESIADQAEKQRAAGETTKALVKVSDALQSNTQGQIPFLSIPFLEAPISSKALKVLKEARYERRELRVLRASEKRLTAVALSPDGTRVAMSSADNVIRIFSRDDGALVGTLVATHSGDEDGSTFGSEDDIGEVSQFVSAIAFSPDGKRLAGGSTSGIVYVWDVGTQEPSSTIERHTAPITAVSFDISGKRILSAGRDSSAYIWESEGDASQNPTWTAKAKLYPEPDGDVPRAITDAAFDRSGERVLLGFENGTAEVWRRSAVNEDQTEVWAIGSTEEGPAKTTPCAEDNMAAETVAADCPIPNGQAAAPPAKASVPIALSRHNGPISAVAFSPDGNRFLVAAHDRIVDIFDSDKSNLVTRLIGHQDKIYDASFSPDSSMVVTVSADQSMRLWNAQSGAELFNIRGHDKGIFAAEFSADGETILTGSEDGTARLWNARRSIEVPTLKADARALRLARFEGNQSEIVTASDDGAVRVWDRETMKIKREIPESVSSISSIDIGQDGKTALTASGDNSVKVWNLLTGRLERSFPDAGSVEESLLSPDGSFFVIRTRGGGASLGNTSGDEMAVDISVGGFVSALAISPDQRHVLVGTNDGFVRLWSIQDRALVAALAQSCAGVCPRHGNAVNNVKFSPTGEYAVSTGYDNTAKIWSVKTGKLLGSVDLGAVPRSVAINPKSDQIAFGFDDGLISRYQFPNLVASQKIGQKSDDDLHQDRVLSLAYGADGSMLLSASQDRTARLWDAKTGANLATLRGHSGYVVSAGFSPDEKWILTASTDGTARIWRNWSDAKTLIQDTSEIMKMRSVGLNAQPPLTELIP